MTDKLDIVREKLWKQIQHHTSCIQGLQEKLRKVDEVIGIRDEVEGLLNGKPETANESARYQGKGTTEALRDTLDRIASSSSKSLREIREFMVRNGFVYSGGNISTAINTNLNRFEKTGHVIATKGEDGEKRYQLNPLKGFRK